MDFPGRLIAGLLVVVLIVMFPLQYIAHVNNESIDALVDDKTRQFSDSIRAMGHLDKQMYENYVDYLDTTGERYDIELQDILPVRGDEYSFNNNENATRSTSLESVSYNKIQSFASHTHSGACYAGDLHVCNGTDCEVESIVVGIEANSLYYSKNGTTWTKATMPAGYQRYQDITYGNSKFIASSGGNVYISLDGMNWDEHTFVISNRSFNDGTDIIDITYADNGYFYATAVGRTEQAGRTYHDYYIVRSSDGINWTEVKYIGYFSGDGTSASKIAYAKMGDLNRLYIEIYSSYSSIRAYGYGYCDILNDGSLSGLVTNTETYRIMDSTIREVGDYALMNSYTTSNSEIYYSNRYGPFSRININYVPDVIQYGDGIYLAINLGAKSLYISNEITKFTKITYHNLSIPISVSSNMIYFGDRFMFSGGGRVYMSPDGLSWTSAPTPVQFRKLACNANRGTGEIDSGYCSKVGKYYDDAGEEVGPICDKVVTSIRAKHPTQTVDKGNPINTTAIATYLDGHEGEVNCSSNFNPNLVGTQTVTLSYTGLVGNAKTTGTRTCTISVTVRAVNILTSITVLPMSQTIEKYTFPSFTVRANYDDGTSKILSASEYSVSGYNSKYIGLQSVTISYTEGGVTKRATVNVIVTALLKECPRCNHIYELNPDDTDPGCPICRELIIGIEVTPDDVEVAKGDILPITVMGLYNDGFKDVVTGWDSNYNPERIGLQIVTISYRGYAAEIIVWVRDRHIKCPVCNTEYLESEESCPMCAVRVIRIDASPKDLTIIQYEPINLNVIAYYADGSSKAVDDWAIDRTSVTPGTFQTTVSYNGVSDTISLTVLSINSIECPICGTIYDISESPKGCPICSEEIVGIEAYITSGSNLVQLGTTPNIAIILIYSDEHREFATEGYTLESYNPHELGIQTVTVMYKGFTTTIIVEVVNMLDAITCPNGHVYHKNSDGTDPGCPFCHVGSEVSNIIYFDITYTTEILDELYSIGIYHFQEGNYISVIVTKKDKSLMYRLQNTFFSTSMLGRKKRFIYGGEVNNE